MSFPEDLADKAWGEAYREVRRTNKDSEQERRQAARKEKYYREEARKAGVLPRMGDSGKLAQKWDNKIRTRAGRTGIQETAAHFSVSVETVRAVLDDRLAGR